MMMIITIRATPPPTAAAMMISTMLSFVALSLAFALLVLWTAGPALPVSAGVISSWLEFVVVTSAMLVAVNLVVSGLLVVIAMVDVEIEVDT